MQTQRTRPTANGWHTHVGHGSDKRPQHGLGQGRALALAVLLDIAPVAQVHLKVHVAVFLPYPVVPNHVGMLADALGHPVLVQPHVPVFFAAKHVGHALDGVEFAVCFAPGLGGVGWASGAQV